MTGHGPLVVVAEDEEDIRRLISLQLRSRGYRVVECRDGGAAVDACRQPGVDLAIVDVDMPVLDGFAVLRTIRAEPALDGLPVILLTAHALEGGVVTSLDLGAQDYLRKPFEADELRARIDAAVRLRRRTEELVEAVTQQKRAAEALLASEANSQQRFRDFLDHSGSIAFLKDLGGRYLFVNRGFAELTGAHPADLVGTTVGDHFDSDAADRHRAADLAIITTGEPQWFEEASGDQTYLAVKFPVHDADGTMYGIGGILTDITARKRAEQLLDEANAQLAWRAFHDELTGLANRALLADRLDHALRRAGRAGTEVGLLFLDLDHFKAVNDSFGHGAGDRLLVEIARRLRDVVRPGDTVARMGGDEFIVLLEDFNSAADVARIMNRLGAAVREPFVLDGHTITTTVSIGLAIAHDQTADTLLRAADTALYRAKDRGRNRYEIFGPDLPSPDLLGVGRSPSGPTSAPDRRTSY